MFDTQFGRDDHQPAQSDRLQETSVDETKHVEGGRRVDDGCYLHYGYYCPSQELKPFTM